jgi:hypothetical protein
MMRIHSGDGTIVMACVLIVISLLLCVCPTRTQAASILPSVEYKFDALHAGGVTGVIHVMYDNPVSNDDRNVTITADIDMRQLNMTQVVAMHSACTPPIHEYQWYLVVNNRGHIPLVGFLNKCDPLDHLSNSLTLNQVDLDLDLREVDATPGLAAQTTIDENEGSSSSTKSFKCCAGDSPHPPSHDRTRQEQHQDDNVQAIKVNLSDRLGRLIVQEDGRVHQRWENVSSFPPYNQVTPRWSIVLHAVCGKHTSPPIVCARVDFALTSSNGAADYHYCSAPMNHHARRKSTSIVIKRNVLSVFAFIVASSLFLFFLS